MVDRVGGLTVIPEMAVDHLTEGQREKVFHFRKPYRKRNKSYLL
jgi:LysR family hydrogen peroxide-inducible transcriptional activator